MTLARRPSRGAAASLALVAAILVAPTGARAGEGSKSEGPPHVDYAPIALPVILDGRLVNYVFIALRLTARPGGDANLLKAREPYVRDRLVRIGHAQAFVRPGDATHVDERRLIALVQAEADRLVGPHLLTRVEVLNQTPRRRTGLSAPPRPRTIIP